VEAGVKGLNPGPRFGKQTTDLGKVGTVDDRLVSISASNHVGEHGGFHLSYQ